uniref:Uncharacterized protein n=1 Tax=Tanacetum cinerariifolium TaxID=118510 RepID=A0A6L2KV49_TANCI|nr:hypothetical protein [Tanacetum cinerariifolium]
MHQEEHLGFDDEYDFLTNTIPYKKLSLVSNAKNVSTEASAATSDQIAMIAILNNLTSQQEIGRLDIQKIKLDLENQVRHEQGLVIQRNQRNAKLLKENELLKSTLSAKDKSIKFLKSKKEKVLTDKRELVDSYLDDIISLQSANRVTKEMLQRFNMPTHTIPMLSNKPRRATADLHPDILGTRNLGLGYLVKHTQPVLYDGNTLLDPTHTPVSVWDSDDVLVHQVISMHKKKDKPGHVRPKSDFYAKLNAIKFVPQTELSRE